MSSFTLEKSLKNAWPLVKPTPLAFQRWLNKDEISDVFRDSSIWKQLFAVGVTSRGEKFEAFDTWNLALLSRSGRTRPELEMIYTLRLLSGTENQTSAKKQIELEAKCPLNCTYNEDTWESPPPLEGCHWIRCDKKDGQTKWFSSIILKEKSHPIYSPDIKAYWENIMNHYRFHYTHPELALQTSLTHSRKVGDCTALSNIFYKDLLDIGFNVRIRSGFLLGSVTARAHQIIEIEDSDGIFKYLDPSIGLLGKSFVSNEITKRCFGTRFSKVLLLSVGARNTIQHNCKGKIIDIEPLLLSK